MGYLDYFFQLSVLATVSKVMYCRCDRQLNAYNLKYEGHLSEYITEFLALSLWLIINFIAS